MTCFMGMQIVWCSKLKSRIALSSTEVEHVALSTCLKYVMHVISLVVEIPMHVQVKSLKPIIKCRLIGETESFINIVRAPFLIPRTKHIALEHHHFRWHVDHVFFDARVN